jgi:hypothetical protein
LGECDWQRHDKQVGGARQFHQWQRIFPYEILSIWPSHGVGLWWAAGLRAARHFKLMTIA